MTQVQASLMNCPVKLSKLEKSLLKTYLNCEDFDHETPIIFVDKNITFKSTRYRKLLSIESMDIIKKNPEAQVVGEPIYYIQLYNFKLKYKDD
jgi:hypothetical protein